MDLYTFVWTLICFLDFFISWTITVLRLLSLIFLYWNDLLPLLLLNYQGNNGLGREAAVSLLSPYKIVGFFGEACFKAFDTSKLASLSIWKLHSQNWIEKANADDRGRMSSYFLSEWNWQNWLSSWHFEKKLKLKAEVRIEAKKEKMREKKHYSSHE